MADNLARKGVYDEEPEGEVRPRLRVVRPGDTAADFEPKAPDLSEPEAEEGERPNLSVIDGDGEGGDAGPENRPYLRSVPTGKDLDEDSLNTAEKYGDKPSSIEDKNAKAEKDATVGKDYNGAATDDSRKSVKKVMGEGLNLKRALLGGGIFAGGSGLLMSFFILIAPLKMIHIMTNLQHKFSANAETAAQKEMDHLFTSYLARYVMPGMGGAGACKSTMTITKDCVRVAPGDSPMTKLYNGWRDARFENKLAKDYGMEFKKKPDGTFWMKSKILQGDGVNISDVANGKVPTIMDSDGFKKLGTGPRSAYRAAIADYHKSMEGETRFKQVWNRIKVGSLLKEKYAFKRCIFFCSTRDAFDEKWATNVKNPSKLALAAMTQRIFMPEDEVLNVAFRCVLDKNCDPSKTRTTSDTCTPGVDCAMNGEPLSPEESDAQKAFNELASKMDAQGADDLIKLAGDIETKGYAQVLFERLFGEVGGKVFSTLSTKVIPIIGWIDLGAQLVTMASTIPKAWVAMGYVVVSVQAVNAFSTWRVMTDEAKTGNTTNDLMGAMTTRLGHTGTKDQNDSTAEGHPIYKELIDGGYGSQPPSSSSYKCDDGKPVPFGKYLCPEELLLFDNSVLNAIRAFFDGPGIILKGIAKVWEATIGKLFELVGVIIGWGIDAVNAACDVGGVGGVLLNVIPGVFAYCEARAQALKYGPELMKLVISYIFKVPLALTSSGGRLFSTLATGAHVLLGHDMMLYGMGGMMLSAAQSVSLHQEQNTEDQAEYALTPLKDRIFSTTNSKSFISRLALAMPSNLSASLISGSLTSLANPLSMLTGGLTSLFSGSTAHASPGYIDYFGDGAEVGIPVDNAVYTRSVDPEAHDNQWDLPDPSHPELKCKDGSFTKKWNEDAIKATDESPVGQPVYKYVNPCITIQSSTVTAGAVFTSNVLSDDDKGIVPPDANAGGTTTGTAASCGTEQQCAQAILNNSKIHFLFPNTRSDFEAAAAGRTVSSPAPCSATHLNTTMMAVILAITQKYEVGLTAIVTDHHCNDGRHPVGKAFDVDQYKLIGASTMQSVNMFPANSQDNQFASYVATLLPTGGGVGQKGCNGYNPTIPSGINFFDDTCNHMHFDVGDIPN